MNAFTIRSVINLRVIQEAQREPAVRHIALSEERPPSDRLTG
ncbi:MULTISPECIES: hypothetical protein [Brenneria]|nr:MULTISPECIES: hypothetical protein [Brenneria]